MCHIRRISARNKQLGSSSTSESAPTAAARTIRIRPTMTDTGGGAFPRVWTVCMVLVLLSLTINTVHTADTSDLKVKHGCDGTQLIVRCPKGEMISVLKTLYGRINLHVCNPDAKDYAHRSCVYNNTEQIKRSCDGLRKCSLPVRVGLWEDRCPQTDKYLQVEYSCVPFQATTTESTTTTTTTKQPVVPSTASEQSQKFEEVIAPKQCAPHQARDIEWPSTDVGHWANMPCPNDPDQSASWLCASTGNWSGDSADLSDCRSSWARMLERRLVHVDTVETCIQTIDVLQTNTSTHEQIYGGDTLVAAQVLNTVVDRMHKLLPGKFTDDRKQFAAELNKRVATTVNNLLHSEQSQSWRDLPQAQQQATAAKLLRAVDQSSLLLAANMVVGDTTQTSKQKNLFVEVAVVELRTDGEYVQFPGTLLNSANRINLPHEALRTTSHPESAAVSFAEFKTLGSVLAPVPYVSATERDGRKELVQRAVASDIVSASVAGAKGDTTLTHPVSITFSTKAQENWGNQTCAFWNTSAVGEGRSQGEWQSTGCSTNRVNRTHTVCQCHHLTSFAVLMDVHGTNLHPDHNAMLTLLTYLGCSVSVVCLLASLFLFCVFSRNQVHTHCSRMMVHAHLCLCLLVAEVLFMLGIAQTQQPVLCTAIAVSLHYFFLAAFAWMFLEGFELYQMLVTVYESGTDRRLYYIFGYGAPAAVVGASVAFGLHKYGTAQYCWLSTEQAAIWWFVAPVLVVIIANIVFLSLAAVQVWKYRRHDTKRRQYCGQIDADKLNSIVVWLKGAWAMIVLLGVTWLTGLLYVNRATVVWAYVFTVLNSLQGVFIFLFHIYWNDRLRRRCQLLMNTRRASSIPRGPPNFVNVFDHTGKAQPFGFNFANSSEYPSSPVPDSNSTELSNSNQFGAPFAYRVDTVDRQHCAQNTPLLVQHSHYSTADDQYDCVGYSASMLAYPVQQPAHQPITPSQDLLSYNPQHPMVSSTMSQPSGYRCPPRFDPPPPPSTQPPDGHMYVESSEPEQCSTSDYDRSASAAQQTDSLGRGDLGVAGSPKQRSLSSADSAYSDERPPGPGHAQTVVGVAQGYELPDSMAWMGEHGNGGTPTQNTFRQLR